jgi:uncharacterized OB-fold protein
MTAGRVSRDEQTAAFFDAAAAGALLISRCASCGQAAEPMAVSCHGCGGTELEPLRASGGAALVSWTVCHPRPSGGAGGSSAGAGTGHDSDGPVILVIGELDEGPWWWALLTGADPGTLRAGQRLRLAFEHPPDSEPVPVFRLADVPPAGDLRP